jgi:hypothetical protein
VTLLAVPLALAIALLLRSSTPDDVDRGPARADPSAFAPALAATDALDRPASASSLTLAFPSRARLDARVLVTFERGPEELGSFLLVSSARGASAQGAQSVEGPLEVGHEGVDVERAEVTLSLGRVPAGVTAVRAKTVDLVEPALRSDAVAFRPDDQGRVRLELRVPERSGFLAVRATRAGEPLDDVVVHLRRGAEVLRSFRVRARAPTVVSAPPDEALSLEVADSPGLSCFGPVAPTAVRVEPGRIVDVDVVLPAGTAVCLRALDAHGEAAAFALALWRVEADGPRHVATSGLLRADAESRTWRGRLPSGAYVAVAAPRAHFGPASARFEVGREEEAERSIEFALDGAGVRTRVRLTEADGTAIERELVNLNRETEDVEAAVAHVARTDAQGTFTTPPLPGGAYTLHVWSRGLSRRVDLGGGGVLELALPDVSRDGASGSLRGKVLGPDGQPARWPKVFLLRDDGWSLVSHLDVEGRYAFARVEPGDREFEVRTTVFSERRYRPHRGRARVEASGETVEDVRLEAR